MSSLADGIGDGDRGQPISPRWLASMLLAASLTELAILRIGTRTAVHVPGLEHVAGPYRVLSNTGRLAFYSAVVLLGALLGSLARDLYRTGQPHIAACLALFLVVATLGWLGAPLHNATAYAVAAIVFALAVGASRRRPPAIALVIGLFSVAYLIAASPAVLQAAGRMDPSATPSRLVWWGELLAVGAGIGAGPLVRRGIGLRWKPTRRLISAGAGAGVLIAGALLASPSTVHILLLWNFGLTGVLPAALYGLAAASVLVAVVSCARNGHDVLALAIVLFVLGGVGLTSTYQSGLVIAALGLANHEPARVVTARAEGASGPGQRSQRRA